MDEVHDGAAETLAGAVRLAEEVAPGGGEAYGERRRRLLGELIEEIRFDETVEGEEDPPTWTPKGRSAVSRL